MNERKTVAHVTINEKGKAKLTQVKPKLFGDLWAELQPAIKNFANDFSWIGKAWRWAVVERWHQWIHIAWIMIFAIIGSALSLTALFHIAIWPAVAYAIGWVIWHNQSQKKIEAKKAVTRKRPSK